jgi:hypothetical protein
MRPLCVRFTMIVASACALLLLSAGAAGTGHAATYLVPTGLASAYYWPASYATVYYPSAYYGAPAVISPAAYYVPSAYTYPAVVSSGSLPTARLVSTDYTVDSASSGYYMPTQVTRYYTTSGYIPTYSVVPSVWDPCCVPAPACCDVVAAPAIRIAPPPSGANAERRPIPLGREPGTESAGPSGGRRPIPLEREPQEGGTISSRVKSPPEAPAADRAQPAGRNERPENKKAPAEPAPARDNDELEPAPPLDTSPTRRDSMRPTYSSQGASSLVQAVLRGRVESDAGESREGVRVTVASKSAIGRFHSGMSDAFGGFAIRLEDGDWTVRVTMPSGRAYAVREISVKDGKVIDSREGREIPNLIISY